MMNSYDIVSDFYDSFTKGFDYSCYLEKCLSKIKTKPHGNLAVDLGCGTGNLLSLLVKNFDCTGVDISENMLQKASEKEELKSVNFVCQSLEELDLYGAYDYAFCSLDTVNHLTEKNSVKAFFKKIANFIEPGGVFIFDIKNLDTFKNSAKTEIYRDKNSTLIWEGFFEKPCIFHDLTFFYEDGDKISKEEAEISERYYSDEEIREMMEKCSPLTFERSFSYKKERTVFIYRKKDNGQS